MERILFFPEKPIKRPLFLRLMVADEGHSAGVAVHDVAGDVDVFWHEGVVDDDVDRFSDGLFHGVKAGEPALKFDATVAHDVDVVRIDAAGVHFLDHAIAVNMADAAIGVADDHDFFTAEFVDGNEQAAHGAAKRAGNDAASVLDDFGIAVFDAESGR